MNPITFGNAAKPLASIHSYHAHIYFDPASTRVSAEALRQQIAERFVVQMGRWHEVPVGPHNQAMYQVAFTTALFASFVPWLMINRGNLDVLVHPNTLAPRDDHLRHALWLGERQPLIDKVLPMHIDAAEESAIVVNTSPTLAP
jgi:aromatic ring-cleaving dioxygenase